MNKRAFLKSAGLFGVVAVLPSTGKLALSNNQKSSGDCVLIPSETTGPFPLDLSDNTYYFRNDIREDREGVQFNMKLKILGLSDCAPMQNVRVNIWHCDKDGNYSGYDTETGLTYLRGYQITDVNGEVEFITIFPGWYPGRVCHIHFQVYVSSSYAAISQLTFNQEQKTALYEAHPDIYTEGPDPLTPDDDGIFVSGGYTYQICDVIENATTGGYDAFLQVTVEGSGTVGIGYLEMQHALQFILGQNQPNPCYDETTIPLTILKPGEVTLELYDNTGKKAARVIHEKMQAGNHNIKVHFKALGIAKANYVYQLTVRNNEGVFKTCKMLSVI
jgi:protocatechuate 3,4-dioxygenase beta subunit